MRIIKLYFGDYCLYLCPQLKRTLIDTFRSADLFLVLQFLSSVHFYAIHASCRRF